jgi:polyhydroxyalkanoate synthesis regulator protein
MRFTIQKESEIRESITYHEEDIKREPTLFEQAMQGFNEENSDDDLSEEEEDSKVEGSFGSKKKQAKIDNSDEEVEESKDD